jgi:ribosomal protein S18 acetylase RimI-like enzyme
MAVISEPLAPSSSDQRLRPFDVRRDLGAVADLVELCFADTLDPDGRDYLARMRSASRNSSILGWATAAVDLAGAPLTGYVWQQDDRIVGNVSLIPYILHGRRHFLIANVATHPDYRRQGIARRLTERAIEHARRRSAPAVWLHVREENQGALQLYRSLGFIERAVRSTWLSQPDFIEREALSGARIASVGRRHWAIFEPWLRRSYPAELAWHMPLRIDNLRPGLLGGFFRLLYNTYLEQWGILQGERLQGVVSWQPARAHANLLWLAAPLNGEESAIQALLVHARRHAPTQRPLMLDYPARQYAQAIQGAGFKAQQTLVWMELKLGE